MVSGKYTHPGFDFLVTLAYKLSFLMCVAKCMSLHMEASEDNSWKSVVPLTVGSRMALSHRHMQ